MERGRRLSGWWAGRSLRVRITTTVGGVAFAALGALAWMATGLIGLTVTGAVDVELAKAAEVAAGHLASGMSESAVSASDDPVTGISGQIEIRVTDPAGRPLDGGEPVSIGAADLAELSGRSSLTVFGADGPTRWLGTPAAATDGAPRLVLAGADLVGFTAVLRRGAVGLTVAAVLAALGVTLAA